jgi:hypothetical protein
MGKLIMSRKEREQAKVFELLDKGFITQKTAATRLKLSDRWVRKKLKRFRLKGDEGLVHAARGRPSCKQWDITEKELAISLLKSEWYGFGPTFAAEKLQKFYNIKVSKETLRKAMINNGVWRPKRRRGKHRKRRERREMFGMMIQLDGSPHDWFEGRAPSCTLLVFIDDATSKIVWLEFVKSESLEAVMRAVRNYTKTCGRPLSFYVDFGSVFSVNTNNPDREKKTQWERSCQELNIEVIHAKSPQAKGRVERANKTMQDRLIKEMRLANISSMKEANMFIKKGFLADHNNRFAVPAVAKGDAHRSIDGYNLDTIFCIKQERLLQNDFTISYRKRILQLDKQQRTLIRPKNTITVHELLDGTIRLFIRKTKLFFSELKQRPVAPSEVLEQPRYYKPASNHPWRTGFVSKQPLPQMR